MIYLAIVQLENVEGAAYRQSQSNIRTANSLILANIQATFGKIYLLENALNLADHSPYESQKFTELSHKILKRTANFADVIVFNKESNRYSSTKGVTLEPAYSNDTQWHPLDSVDQGFYISSVYKNQDQRWVFAVKHSNPSFKQEIWIEFDLLHTTQGLRDLKTLEKGYVFVVDRNTGKLVFHPDPKRIGDHSISYNAGISELVTSGITVGQYEYYYRDHFKVSVFNADNTLNWVFVSGTDRQDILSSSYQFSLTAVVIASLFVLTVVINYLIYQLNTCLADLNRIKDLASFKHQLKSIFDKFIFHEGVQFVLFDESTQSYYTLDYHGNRTVVFVDNKLASSFAPSSLSYKNGHYVDPLAKLLKISGRHYCIPLFDQDSLIALIYVKATFPAYKSILRMIRDYTEVALSNLLLHHQLENKDVMTQLDNKSSLMTTLESSQQLDTAFLALIEIDNFDFINSSLGSRTGDQMILKTADFIRQAFPKPSGLSLARTGGKEFGLLFKANDMVDAQQQIEQLKASLANCVIEHAEKPVIVQFSAGVTSVVTSQLRSVEHAEFALRQAQLLGKNRVECYADSMRNTA
ncbi:GGDEF domain-containing protein [Vibrio sp. T187]|uniref:sensor domain-containing diguanylate cyclase n=1 Tax=Vibrio TaxID=662 RepID=UPI0010C9F584|nr:MULTISPECIES: diguanylate cyclase [Vibrio]MBW3695398.1 GGDEF domain-containing protein [Vibrio sp. T187]